jgi:copper transport protein
MTSISSFALIAIISLILLTLAPNTARAHGYLIRAIPDDRAVLERSPARVQYWFSEGLEPAYSTIVVRDQAGNAIATGGLSENDDKLLTVRLPSNLPDGAYAVDLRLAFASDGHVIAERRVFFVGEVVAGVGGQAASTTAVPLEVVWRALSLAAVTLLTGVVTLYALVLVPAWGNPTHAAGLLPQRVMQRLFLLSLIALALSFVGNGIALIQQTMEFFGVDAWRAISEGLWNIVRTGSRFGDTWNARMLLLVIVAALLGAAWYFRREQPALVRAFWMAAAWAMPLVWFTFSIAAHAAGSLVLPWLAIASDWLHGTAVGVWVGGLSALALVLPAALRPLEGDSRMMALRAALGRFSRVALMAAIVVIATGIYNATNWFNEGDDVTTPYGASLALKIVMVAGLLLLGAVHHISLRPERYGAMIKNLTRHKFLSTATRTSLRAWRPSAKRREGDGGEVNGTSFMPTLRLESIIGIITVVLAGWVAATPVPQLTFAAGVPAPTLTQQADIYTVTTTITPGGPGANTYDVQVSHDGQAVDNLDVRVQLVNPLLGRRGERHVAEPSGDGLYVAAGAEAARAGEWWALIDIVHDGQLTRAAYTMPIREEASVILTRPPNLLNLAALAGVLVAIGAAVYPLGKSIYARLDLTPVSIVVALAAIVFGIAVTGWAVWLADQSNVQAEAALFPPPQIVNTVLPDADSLARGARLFETACGWNAYPDAVRDVSERLERLRDEELFAFTRDGWRDLPGCSPEMRDNERWDVVNYVRTLG